MKLIHQTVRYAIIIAMMVVSYTTTTALAQASEKPSNNPTQEYKNSLSELSRIQQQEIDRLNERSATIQQLFDQGLISRRDLEQHQQTLTQARAKVAETEQKIKLANTPPEPTTKIDEYVAKVATGQTKTDWTTGNIKIDQLIKQNGGRYGVDPYLIYCVMSQESGFNATATSNKGAQGLMQLMPDTAARFGVSDPFDPAQSIMAGTRYLKFLLDKFDGDLSLVLAGYNAGEGTVIKYGNRIPPYSETKIYVRNISLRYLGR